MAELKRLLVPVDLSEVSRKGLLHAVKMAKHLEASVHVLYVWDAPVFIPTSTLVTIADGRSAPLGDLARQNAEGQLVAMVESVRPDKGLAVTTEVVFGEPAQVITRAAQHADIVVMGTRQRVDALRFWLGSVAEKVIRTSPTPVLTVPSPHQVQAQDPRR